MGLVLDETQMLSGGAAVHKILGGRVGLHVTYGSCRWFSLHFIIDSH